MTPPAPLDHVRLDDLIAAITTSRDAPLDRLSDAVLVAEHLGEVSDHLVGHFVDQARRSGASWSEIGRSMGVTKQAAQRRFVPRGGAEQAPLDPEQGFARFTDRARGALMAAHEAARAAGNVEMIPAHLSIGLTADPGSLAATALTALGVEPGSLRDAALATLPPRCDVVPDLVPYDAASKKVLELTFREALRLGHAYVGTEHLLLALLEQEAGTAAGTGIFAGLGVDKPRAEAAIRAALDTMAAGQAD